MLLKAIGSLIEEKATLQKQVDKFSAESAKVIQRTPAQEVSKGLVS